MSAEAKRKPKPRPGLIIVWEFLPQPDKRPEFEDAYGPKGVWAQFFRSGDGYIRTELHSDRKSSGRYLTLDYWESRAAFDNFKQTHAAGYKAIDEQYESLTAEEKFLGHCDSGEQLRELLLEHGIDLGEEPRIRPAIVPDIPAMLALEQNARSAAHWDVSAYESIFDPNAPQRIALLLETNGQLQGLVVARITGNDWELENIVVNQNSQRRGLGRQLLTALIDSVSESATSIFLEVRESNMAARALYEKCGFVISGRRTAYYRHPPEDAITYILQL
jgi:[ribosomal protein S18]-alanine N-acetyltransferase